MAARKSDSMNSPFQVQAGHTNQLLFVRLLVPTVSRGQRMWTEAGTHQEMQEGWPEMVGATQEWVKQARARQVLAMQSL
jgi:hypothetical protein